MKRKARYIHSRNKMCWLVVWIVKRKKDWWKPSAAVVGFQFLDVIIPKPNVSLEDFLSHMRVPGVNLGVTLWDSKQCYTESQFVWYDSLKIYKSIYSKSLTAGQIASYLLHSAGLCADRPKPLWLHLCEKASWTHVLQSGIWSTPLYSSATAESKFLPSVCKFKLLDQLWLAKDRGLAWSCLCSCDHLKTLWILG